MENRRGRPITDVSIEAVNRLEADMRKLRKQKLYDRGEMIWTCPVTRETLFIDYPVSYSPQQVIIEMLKRDVDHNHKAWETYIL